MMLSMSQERLAGKIGVSFQQIQKYEKGVNRIGASRMVQIANVLEVAPAFFYEGAPTLGGKKAADADLANDPVLVTAFFSTPHAAELAKAFCSIASEHRKVLVLVARAMAQS